jgi:LacI family transcriptional regulator
MGPAFAAAVGEAGHACASYAAGESPKVSRNWLAQQRRLGAWLIKLPKPLAVFTWNSERGRQVIDACAAIGLRVPDDVAVLAADDDEVTCELSDPPLSAIDHGPRRIGHAAAELLDRLMRGAAPPAEPVLFAPAGVVPRQSTDVLAVEDRDVAAALRFIQRHATEPIGVDDVVRATRLSRRMLELRFARRLGRSPAAEIRRLRVERAQRLLAGTPLTVTEIAEASGFQHAEVMNRIFRREMNTTPTLYRKQMRS